MKLFFFIISIVFTTGIYSQQIPRKRSTKKNLTAKDFIGTWTLTKLANIHLNYRPGRVYKEILRLLKTVFLLPQQQITMLEHGRLLIRNPLFILRRPTNITMNG